jgi:hypothetical protein
MIGEDSIEILLGKSFRRQSLDLASLVELLDTLESRMVIEPILLK